MWVFLCYERKTANAYSHWLYLYTDFGLDSIPKSVLIKPMESHKHALTLRSKDQRMRERYGSVCSRHDWIFSSTCNYDHGMVIFNNILKTYSYVC